MNRRCSKPGDISYHLYGGRGIVVAPGWVGPGGFEKFFDHIGVKPSAKHMLDRIDNSGNYEPGNVRWATPRDQQRNRRSNHCIEYGGERLTLVEWSERTGIKRETIAARLKRGLSAKRALGM